MEPSEAPSALEIVSLRAFAATRERLFEAHLAARSSPSPGRASRGA